MKRSKSINLNRMRKSIPGNLVKPLALAVATSALVACSNQKEAKVYQSVETCKNDNPDAHSTCEAAYQKALQEAYRTGPKYSSLSDCESEFGSFNCGPYNHRGQNWVVPLMAGFIFAKALDSRDGFYSSPVFTSYNRSSPMYGDWISSNGYQYPKNYRTGKVVINNDTFKPKPTVNRTISRGGFGSVVSAKSSWGGSSKSSWGSSKGGWGG